MSIKEENRPLYYIDKSYSPELGHDYSNWNNTTDFLPDMGEWVWDQLDFYVRHNIKIKNINQDKGVKIISALKTARKYNKTSTNNNNVDMVVTHMYVCELLLQVLSMIGGNNWAYGHGYKFSGSDEIDSDIFSTKIELKDGGLAHEIHKLFFIDKLKSNNNIILKDYLTFCPELRKFMFEIEKTTPRAIGCSEEGYGATGAHPETDGKDYHVLVFATTDYHALLKTDEGYNAKEEHEKNFPELVDYNVANRWSSFAVQDEILSDKFISITRDPENNLFALGFGQSPVQKQRDVEVRFGVVFTLGSLGRYRPWIWNKIEEENPQQYYAIKKFLENNYLLFPYLILGYLSGKYFTFNKTAVLG